MPILCALVALAFPPAPTGAEILSRSQQAYDGVKTFEETVKGTIGKLAGTGHIYFQRPSSLSVTGTSLFGSKYALLCNAKSVSVLNGGSWTSPTSVEMGIATITGISANAGSTIPATLMHTQFGSILGNKGPWTVASANLYGHPVFRLDTEQPFPTTLWIDPSTFFLVKSSVKVGDQVIVQTYDPPKVNRPIPPAVFKR